VLGAEHTDALVVALERHVEHCADIVRDEVSVAEFAGARIRLGIVRRNDALALDRSEVGGRDAAGQYGPRVILIAATLMQADAADV
jgi:hypothetical protein